MFAEACGRAAAKRSALAEPTFELAPAKRVGAELRDARLSAVLRDCEAETRFHEQRPLESLRCAKEAWADYDVLGLEHDRNRLTCGIVLCYLDLGRLDVTIDWNEQLRAHAPAGSPLGAHVLFSHGRVRHLAGDLDAARTAYADATALAREAGDVHLLAHVSYWEGERCLAEGRFGRASVAFRCAERRFVAAGETDSQIVSLAGVALSETLDGDDENARATLTLLAKARPKGHAARAVLELRRWQLESLHERRRMDRSVADRRGPDGRPLVQSSALYRVVANLELRPTSLDPRTRSARLEPARVVKIDEGFGAAFVGASRFDITGPKLQALLQVLVEHRQAAPGAWVSHHALAEALWPSERMLPAARSNRTKVLISRLRGVGLAGLIESRRGAIRLDPSVDFFMT